MADIADFVLSPALLIYAFLLFLVNTTIVFIVATLRPRAFPPGPRGFPGFGNLFQLNKAFPFLIFDEWAKQYGRDTPLGVKRGTTNVVVLNSERLVHELLEKRGAIYSDRPWQYMNSTWIFKDDLKTALFVNSSPWHTRWRKEFINNFGPMADARLRPVYEAESARLLVKLLQSPHAKGEQLESILVCWLVSVPCLGACGRRPDDMEDLGFTVDRFRKLTDEYASLMAPTVSDMFPILRYLPRLYGMAAWKERARVCRDDLFKMGDMFVGAAREQRAAIDEGKTVAWDSVSARMLREQREKNDAMFSDIDNGHSALHILATARATSLGVFSVMLMCLAKYPEHQNRIRNEVLDVSGGATPMAGDLPKLKYAEAFWNEVHRWRPVAPQGVPHASSKDDVYNGHRIPAGTTVAMNIWAIFHSVEDYESPEKFMPERFLHHPFGMRPDESHDPARKEASASRMNYSFGAGRRICPGMFLAKQTLMLGMAKMLWAFDILPPEGKDIDLSLETGFVQKIMLSPKDLDIVLKLREGRSKEDIIGHYSQAYEGEAEVLGWEGDLYK